jgi:hypothetical protein
MSPAELYFLCAPFHSTGLSIEHFRSNGSTNRSIVSAEISNPNPHGLPRLEQSLKEILVGLGMISNSSDIAFAGNNRVEHAYPLRDISR